MAEQTVTTAGAAPIASEPTTLWVERTGTRAYTGRSSRGAEVLIGSQGVPGVFTPGELLKIALAACSGLCADFPLSRKLGDNFDATVGELPDLGGGIDALGFGHDGSSFPSFGGRPARSSRRS